MTTYPALKEDLGKLLIQLNSLQTQADDLAMRVDVLEKTPPKVHKLDVLVRIAAFGQEPEEFRWVCSCGVDSDQGSRKILVASYAWTDFQKHAG